MLSAGGSDLENSHSGKPLQVHGPGEGAGFGLGMVLTPASCFITLNSASSQHFSSRRKGFLYSAYHILFRLLNSKGNKTWLKPIKLNMKLQALKCLEWLGCCTGARQQPAGAVKWAAVPGFCTGAPAHALHSPVTYFSSG